MGTTTKTTRAPGYGDENDWAALREYAVAAREQLLEGPMEWPGTPSRQRLDLFLAASPDTIIALLDERDRLEREVRDDHPRR